MTRQWQVKRAARMHLDASKIANDALLAVKFLQAQREVSAEKEFSNFSDAISLAIEFLKELVSATRAGGAERISVEAIAVLRSLSQSYLTRRTEMLGERISSAIRELEEFKEDRSTSTHNAEDILEKIAKTSVQEIAILAYRLREPAEVRI